MIALLNPEVLLLMSFRRKATGLPVLLIMKNITTRGFVSGEKAALEAL
jgi:hypothetical protein